MVTEQVRCDKCGGLIVRDGDELKCFTCNKPVRSKGETTRFMQTNRDEILVDAQGIGVSDTAKKWGISAAAVYSLVREYRVTPAQPGRQPESPRRPGNLTPRQPGDGTVVSFPAFSEKWDPQVQIKWLEIYLEIVKFEANRSKGGDVKCKVQGMFHSNANI